MFIETHCQGTSKLGPFPTATVTSIQRIRNFKLVKNSAGTSRAEPDFIGFRKSLRNEGMMLRATITTVCSVL